MSDRQGIEIDYCPQCRGVWLDRGELDKMIERNSIASATPQDRPAPTQHYSDNRNDSYQESSHKNNGHKRKKEGFLGELFDF